MKETNTRQDQLLINTIENAIAHLNGYVVLLEAKGIPTLAVKKAINELRGVK